MAQESKRPRLIGLTGSYCAGKNHVARLLEARGLEVLDVDTLGHRALETEAAAVGARFGAEILAPDGSVKRRALGERVFGKPEELAALEAIVHPAANRLSEAWVAERTGAAAVINAALLHRSSLFPDLDFIILVRASFLTRFLRALRRDRLSAGELLKRFASQRDFASKYSEKKTDIHTVDNRGVFRPCARFWRARLERRIDAILEREGLVR